MAKQKQLSIADLQADKAWAWEMLFEQHYAVLAHYANTLLRDKPSAELVTDEVIYEFYLNRHHLDQQTPIRSYLLRAIHNRCLNYLRDRLKFTSVDTELLAQQLLDISPENSLLASELENQIANIIDSLPEATKTVFELHRFENKSYDEIATLQNISPNTVKYHIQKALTQLRTALRDYLMSIFL